jgi:hypothetical protein
MKMEIQPTLRHETDPTSADAAAADSPGEPRRPWTMDAEAWHDLAERGTPRNG